MSGRASCCVALRGRRGFGVGILLMVMPSLSFAAARQNIPRGCGRMDGWRWENGRGSHHRTVAGRRMVLLLLLRCKEMYKSMFSWLEVEVETEMEMDGMMMRWGGMQLLLTGAKREGRHGVGFVVIVVDVGLLGGDGERLCRRLNSGVCNRLRRRGRVASSAGVLVRSWRRICGV